MRRRRRGARAPVDLARLGHAYALEAYLAIQNSDLTRARPLSRARAARSRRQARDRQLDARVEIIDAVLGLMAGTSRSRLDPLPDRAGRRLLRRLHSSGYSNLAYLDVEHRRLDDAAVVLAPAFR